MFLTYLFLFLLPTFCFALKFSPARYEITLKPGLETQVEYTLTNDYDYDIVIKTSHRDWFIYEENKNFTTSTWLTVIPEKIELKKAQNKKILCKIKAPKDAKGFLVAMVSFTPESETQQVTLILSSALYVILDGTQNIKPEFSDIKISTQLAKINFTIENKGNLYLRPQGEVILTKGNQTLKSSFHDDKPLWPGKKTEFYANFNNLPKGSCSLTINLSCWDKKFSKVYKLNITNK